MTIKLSRVLILLIISALILNSCASPLTVIPDAPSEPINPINPISPIEPAKEIQTERRLYCKHTDFMQFYNSIQNPKEFILNGEVIGGIVPHHMVAANLVSGFFKAVSESETEYDTVIVVAPNHQGETGDIVVSFCDWRQGEIVYCDVDIIGNIYKKISDNLDITAIESDNRMEEEHSVSVLIPYINYYMPKAKVAPILLNRRLTLENIYNFAKILSDEIKESDKKVLLICSIDFSHYLTISAASENDRTTESAILSKNYKLIQSFSNDYVDSPQSLNTFLMYLENTGADNINNKNNNIEILYNTDASEFFGNGITETTSYFIIAAYK